MSNKNPIRNFALRNAAAMVLAACIIAAAAGAFTANMTINSPSAQLSSGEYMFINITSNESIELNYSIDGGIMNSLGNSTSFVVQANGSLPHGVFSNGNHSIYIYAIGLSGSDYDTTHIFNVNDAIPPSIVINLSNNTKRNGSTYVMPVNITSNEYANISYRLNSNPFSNWTSIAKSKVFSINASDGTNTLLVNATDFNNNSVLHVFIFNYTFIQPPSCSDALQNGGETGIDCGGPCSSCVAFTISTDRAQYNLTHSVYLTVVSRPNSTVNVTVKKGNDVSYRHTFVPVFAGAPIAEQRVISNTSNAGNYTITAIMSYLNLTQSLNSTFEVLAPSQNQISVTINANATTIDENSPVAFRSTVTGNITLVSYKWDFKNDGTIDSTESEPIFIYNSNGTFVVNVTVSDGIWNQTDLETIYSMKLYNITVQVRDNATGSVIQGAEVEIDDIFVNTSSEGKSDFIKREGTYTITAKKPGYATFSNKTGVKGYSLVEIYLLEQDDKSPQITLIEPTDSASVSENAIKIKYSVSDKTSSRCNLFLNKNSQGWVKKGTDLFVNPDVESNFTIEGLENATYEWQVECFDRTGNRNSSETWSFNAQIATADENELSVSLEEQDVIAEDIETQIDEALLFMGSYSQDEKEAAEAMQLKKILERAKLEVQRANRDLHSLVWRKLNDTELEKETNAILERIEKVKKDTPKSISVSEKTEFVKYPAKQDIEFALQPLIEKTNLKLSKKDLKNLVESNYKIQSLITVTTKAKNIEVEYIAGNKDDITLIHKIIKAEEEAQRYGFFEVIPKEIADDADKISSLASFEVIQKDPIIKIDISKEKEFAYFVKGKLSLSEAEKIRSLLLEEKIKRQESGFLTGLVTAFVPSEGFSGAFIKTSNIRLILELAIIIALALVFAYYHIGGYDKLEILFNSKLSHLMKEFEYLNVRIANYLGSGKYEESKVLYNEMNQLYRQMPQKIRSRIIQKMMDIHARMDFIFMDNSLNEAFASINENDPRKALHIYRTISGLYRNLPKDYKARIHSRCMELHSKLNIRN
jgi:PKD repeat protein